MQQDLLPLLEGEAIDGVSTSLRSVTTAQARRLCELQPELFRNGRQRVVLRLVTSCSGLLYRRFSQLVQARSADPVARNYSPKDARDRCASA